MIYNYYPGCTLSTKAKQLDMAARRCAEVLGFMPVKHGFCITWRFCVMKLGGKNWHSW